MAASNGMASVVIAGIPVLGFVMTTQTRGVSSIIRVKQVSELCLFMNPGADVPAGYGLLLYYTKEPYANWELIGGIATARPSGIFRTGALCFEENVNIQFGISIEPLDTLNNLEIASKGVEDRSAFAIQIAKDLFNFMASFSHATQPGWMNVPNTIFDQWMERFKRKQAMDPNFYLKEG